MAKRDEIIAMGKGMLDKEGVINFSLNTFLAQNNISKGSFYHHFKTRNELIFAILEEELRIFRANVEEKIYSLHTLQEKLMLIFGCYCFDTPKNRHICKIYEDLGKACLYDEVFNAHLRKIQKDMSYLIVQSIETSRLSPSKRKIALDMVEVLSIGIDGFFVYYGLVLDTDSDTYAVRSEQIMSFVVALCTLLGSSVESKVRKRISDTVKEKK
ncbi:hypothetical protein CCZ01_01520 [Helicobacter monodelphidis]|uniref:TetR/AcrR family transcriptional regulator n=1 Tax=Helicobacter sp. 15-1451 TaxID=2004995 RepID=UPI000DCE8E68|nr:TetR/AcrR family transcriptional regulator [Helicobacter sp. 15-1451]RAX58900.1 hypothetical protein CCZ01_01520 [Helicobacter sp. 15-1451]